MPVSLEQALYLIRSTLITLNDANRSGNYTVLRDLASPEFQGNNTAADLSQIFADLRKRTSISMPSRSRRRSSRRRHISTTTRCCA